MESDRLLMMRTVLFGLVWIAVSSATPADQLCNPVLEIQNRTYEAVTIKWWCNGTSTDTLKGFELHVKPDFMPRFRSTPLDHTSHEFKLTHWFFDTKYQIFVEAVHLNGSITDSSDTIETDLLQPKPCHPLLEILEITLNSIALKWSCQRSDPDPYKGYKLVYVNTFEDDWERLTIDKTQHEFTVKELKCGSSYTFYIEVESDNPHISNDNSNKIDVKLGGPQLYPEKEDFIEVNDSSINVHLDRWKSNCPFKSFIIALRQESNNEIIKESRPESFIKNIEFSGLLANTDYKLSVAVDDLPETGISYEFKTLCNRTAPEAPSRAKLFETHRNFFEVRFKEWECADSFAVEYRKSRSTSWILVSNDTKAEQKGLIIQQVSGGTMYDIRVRATNAFGTTVANYELDQYQGKKRDCGDWTRNGYKCLMFVKQAGLLPKNDAQTVCERFKENMEDVPSLLTIRDKSEDHFVSYVLKLPGSAWLGIHSDDGEVHYWDDGSEVGFSNWANQSSHEEVLHCGQTTVPDSRQARESYYNPEFRRWMKTSCSTWNYVVCEKPVPRHMDEAIEGLLIAVRQLEKRLTESENKHQACEKN